LSEAMSYGLPCLAHNYDVVHYTLGEEGYLDFVNQSFRSKVN